MKNIGIYPGTFDPITYGHIDVIRKSLKFLNKLIVAISINNEKRHLFSSDERLEIVRKALFKDFLDRNNFLNNTVNRQQNNFIRFANSV